MKIRSQLIIKLSAAFLLISASYAQLDHPAWAAKMYKWVDADGNISYQDKPPPKSGKLIETSELQSSSPSTPSPSVANQGRTPVTAYTVENCAGCTQLMTFLRKAEVPVIELSLQNREVQSRILRLSGKISAPTLFIGDTLVTNLSESKLINELKQAGYALSDSVDPPEEQDPPVSSDESERPSSEDLEDSFEKRVERIRNAKLRSSTRGAE